MRQTVGWLFVVLPFWVVFAAMVKEYGWRRLAIVFGPVALACLSFELGVILLGTP